MATQRLLCVTAHPDDESLGFGGTLARYSAEGVETTLVVATRGERGWAGPAEENPGLHALGRIREAETRAAARVLGIEHVAFLGYIDGELDQADPAEAVVRLAAVIRKVRPDVVVTFGLEGAYGHPDHIAVSQLTTAAIVGAADAANLEADGAPHRVARLYHRIWTTSDGGRYTEAFGPVRMEVDGIVRGLDGFPDWMPSARLDTSAHWQAVRDAVACHRSQFPDPAFLDGITDSQHEGLWGTDAYVRVFGAVAGGRTLETDLFSGLR